MFKPKSKLHVPCHQQGSMSPLQQPGQSQQRPQSHFQHTSLSQKSGRPSMYKRPLPVELFTSYPEIPTDYASIIYIHIVYVCKTSGDHEGEKTPLQRISKNHPPCRIYGLVSFSMVEL